MLQFPDINKSPIMTILLDENQKKDIKMMEQFVKNSLNPHKLRFLILSETLPDNLLQSDSMFFILKEDFNKIGLLKKEKEIVLSFILQKKRCTVGASLWVFTCSAVFPGQTVSG